MNMKMQLHDTCKLHVNPKCIGQVPRLFIPYLLFFSFSVCNISKVKLNFSYVQNKVIILCKCSLASVQEKDRLTNWPTLFWTLWLGDAPSSLLAHSSACIGTRLSTAWGRNEINNGWGKRRSTVSGEGIRSIGQKGRQEGKRQLYTTIKKWRETNKIKENWKSPSPSIHILIHDPTPPSPGNSQTHAVLVMKGP